MKFNWKATLIGLIGFAMYAHSDPKVSTLGFILFLSGTIMILLSKGK